MTTGRWFVLVQGLLFAAVAVTALLPGPTLWQSPVLGVSLVVLGVVGVMWSGRFLGKSLTPLPEPNGAGLVAAGPYRWVRHPMYASLVVLGVGVAVATGALWCFVAVVLLVALFAAKARYEERYLVRAYDGYAEYGGRVGRFVPGVGRLRLSTDS
jgi:protein-S-isoprenylcysteine O-methyltransferase Ste14